MARITNKKTRSFRSGKQTCKACGCTDKFDFKVPNRLWKKVVPVEYQNKVVCLECFDELAFEKGVDYCDFIDVLYFAGDQATFKFQAVEAHRV